MHAHSFSLTQRVPQFIQRDIGILCNQLFEEPAVGLQLATAFGPPLACGFHMPVGARRMQPT